MGYNYPHHPDPVGVAAFTVWCILVGFFFGWLRLKSKSVLPAALGHGAINAYIGFGLLIAPAVDEMMTIPLGLPAVLVLLPIAVLAYMNLSSSIRSDEHGPLNRRCDDCLIEGFRGVFRRCHAVFHVYNSL
jgi:hypothetical protein